MVVDIKYEVADGSTAVLVSQFEEIRLDRAVSGQRTRKYKIMKLHCGTIQVGQSITECPWYSHATSTIMFARSEGAGNADGKSTVSSVALMIAGLPPTVAPTSFFGDGARIRTLTPE